MSWPLSAICSQLITFYCCQSPHCLGGTAKAAPSSCPLLSVALTTVMSPVLIVGKEMLPVGFASSGVPSRVGYGSLQVTLSLLAGTYVTAPCTENRAPQSPGLGGSVLLLCPKLMLGFTRCHLTPLWCHPAVPAEQGGCCIPAQRQCH